MLPGGSRRLSAAGLRFLGMMLPPATSAPLTVGPPDIRCPDGTGTGGCRGFLVSHAEDTAGVGALYTPGTVVLSQPVASLRLAPAASASGQSLDPATAPIWRGC
jgi:hypothetical protein